MSSSDDDFSLRGCISELGCATLIVLCIVGMIYFGQVPNIPTTPISTVIVVTATPTLFSPPEPTPTQVSFQTEPTQPLVTEEPTAEKVDFVTCFNSEVVVVTRDGARYGIVSELPAPVDNFHFYNDYTPLQNAGKFVDLAYAPEGSTFEYTSSSNENISVRISDGAAVIVKDGVEETCVPKTTVVPVDGDYLTSFVSDTHQEISACGNDAQTGDRILLAFTDKMILLRETVGGFTYEQNGEVLTVSAQSNFQFQAKSKEEYSDRHWRGEYRSEEYLVDIRVCYTSDTIGVKQEWYLGPSVYWRYKGNLKSWEIVDSNVCSKTVVNWIEVSFADPFRNLFVWQDDDTFDYDLIEETGNLTVKLKTTSKTSVIAENLVPGKALLIRYWDYWVGDMKELLVENCQTFLSPVYK